MADWVTDAEADLDAGHCGGDVLGDHSCLVLQYGVGRLPGNEPGTDPELVVGCETTGGENLAGFLVPQLACLGGIGGVAQPGHHNQPKRSGGCEAGSEGRSELPRTERVFSRRAESCVEVTQRAVGL